MATCKKIFFERGVCSFVNKHNLSSKFMVPYSNNEELLLDFDLDIGFLQNEIYSLERCTLLSHLGNPFFNKPPAKTVAAIQQEIIDKLEELNQSITNNHDFVLWLRNSPSSICGLLFFCSLYVTYNRPIEIIILEQYTKEVAIGEPISIKHILLDCQKIDQLSKSWDKLIQDASILRVIQNNVVINAREDYYDNIYIELLQKKSYSQREFNDLLASLCIPIPWSIDRINNLINAGCISASYHKNKNSKLDRILSITK